MICDIVLYGAIFSCMMRFCREAGLKSTRLIDSAQSPVMIFLEFLLCTVFFSRTARFHCPASVTVCPLYSPFKLLPQILF